MLFQREPISLRMILAEILEFGGLGLNPEEFQGARDLEKFRQLDISRGLW